MSTPELRSVIVALEYLRANHKLPGYLDQDLAEQIFKLKEFLRRLNEDELVIVKNK